MAFGREYALSNRWTGLQRTYIGLFGVVDLPTRLRARAVHRATAGFTGGTIVDFGAGTGVYSYLYSRQIERQVIAVDVDKHRVEDINRIAKKLGRGHLTAIPGDERYFERRQAGEVELILAVEVLQYCHGLEELLRAMCTCLRPGGALVAHVPIRNAPKPCEHHLFTDENLLDLVQKAGFETARIEQTFGPTAQRLCAAFDQLSRRRVLLAFLFPLLLLGTSLTPRVSKTGVSRLLIAGKGRAAA